LNNSQSAILYIYVQVNGTGNILNSANLTVDQNNTGNNSTPKNGTNITVNGSVNISIIKTVNVTGTILNGALVTYIITVVNHSPDSATNLVVIDNLDSRLIYLNSSATLGSYNSTTGNWVIGELNNTQTAILYIYVQVNGTGSIVNVANLTVDQNNTGNNSTSGNETNITVIPSVNISIIKTVNVTGEVLNGALVTYTITVTNHGSNSTTNLVVTDNLDSRLIYLNSFAMVGSYNATTGNWVIGELNNTQSAILYIYVRVNGTGSIVNVANLTVDQNNTGNNSTSGNETNITVIPSVNISIIKTVNVTGEVLNGALVTYTITVTNHGPNSTTNLVVTDVLDSRLIYITSNAMVGSYNYSTSNWTIGVLDNGDSVVLDIFVRLNGTGSIVNVANVTVDQNNIGNNSTGDNETNITVVSSVNLTIIKTVNVTGNILNGGLIKYTITVINNGPDNATGVYVVDIIDTRLVYLSSNANRGNYNVNNGIWTIGNLDSGETVVLNIFVRLNGAGELINVATIVSDQNNTGHNSSNLANITVLPSANLVVVKTTNVTGSVKNGDLIKYTITVSNNGPDTATGVYVIDKLDKRLIYINSKTTIGNYNLVNSSWNIGSLANGEAVVMDIFVRVNGTGNITNIANATANQKTSLGTNSTTGKVDVSALPVVNLKINIGVNETVTTLGRTIVYTITVINLGPDTATGVLTHVDFDTGLIYVSDHTDKGQFKPKVNIPGVWDIGTLFNGESVILTIITKTSILGILKVYANVTSNEALGKESSVNAKVHIDVEPKPKPKPTPDNHNGTNGTSGMKKTGVPFIAIILAFFSILTLFEYRKRGNE
jgi:uncharacterized repeat protein (TIGR01451 family)